MYTRAETTSEARIFIRQRGGEARRGGRDRAMALWDNLHLHEHKHGLRAHLSAARNEPGLEPNNSLFIFGRFFAAHFDGPFLNTTVFGRKIFGCGF